MHWARVVREDDNPEWIGLVHSDGTLSEVKASIYSDEIHVHISTPPGKRVVFHDGYADR